MQPFSNKDSFLLPQLFWHRYCIKAPDYKLETRTVMIKADETETIILSMKPAKVKITDIKLEILDKVYFMTGSYEIDQKSDMLLNEVADVLQHYPNILQVRIEGHTDSQGKARYNKTLSQGRADEVKRYLVEKGVEPTRLTPMGFGEEQPIASNKSKEGRSMNRRVIFVITDSVPMSEFKLKDSSESGEERQDALQQNDHALDIIKQKLDQEAKDNKEGAGEKSEGSEKKEEPKEKPEKESSEDKSEDKKPKKEDPPSDGE